MAADRLEHEREQKAKDDAERRKQNLKEQERQREQRMVWRRWIRKRLSSSSDPNPPSLRIAVRLPTGTRIIQLFHPTQTLTTLYAFVDSQLIPPQLDSHSDPSISPAGDNETSHLELSIEKQILAPSWWGFQLALAFPRKEIPWIPSTTLASVDALSGGGGQVVVEMLQQYQPGAAVASGSESGNDDGYDTEEDE